MPDLPDDDVAVARADRLAESIVTGFGLASGYKAQLALVIREELEGYADARVAEEREACARICEDRSQEIAGEGEVYVLARAAKAIRVRAQPAGQEMEEPSKVVLHRLSDEEQAARMAALADARRREQGSDPRPGEPEGERR